MQHFQAFDAPGFMQEFIADKTHCSFAVPVMKIIYIGLFTRATFQNMLCFFVVLQLRYFSLSRFAGGFIADTKQIKNVVNYPTVTVTQPHKCNYQLAMNKIHTRYFHCFRMTI